MIKFFDCFLFLDKILSFHFVLKTSWHFLVIPQSQSHVHHKSLLIVFLIYCQIIVWILSLKLACFVACASICSTKNRQNRFHQSLIWSNLAFVQLCPQPFSLFLYFKWLAFFWFENKRALSFESNQTAFCLESFSDSIWLFVFSHQMLSSSFLSFLSFLSFFYVWCLFSAYHRLVILNQIVF